MQSLLNQSVLVLNRHWTAVHVTSARRALVLLYGETARVVMEDYSTHDFESWRELSTVMDSVKKITTPSFELAVPEVIMLTDFNRFPPRQLKFSRRNIYMRDNHQCQYCGKIPKKEELTIDHVIPRSRGGKTTWENVVLACIKCNMKKGSKMVQDAGLKLLNEPVRPDWLASAQIGGGPASGGLWQKFVDNAYWNAQLES